MSKSKLLNYFYTDHLFSITYPVTSWTLHYLKDVEKGLKDFIKSILFTKSVKFFWPSRNVAPIDERPSYEEIKGNQRLIAIQSVLSADELYGLISLYFEEEANVEDFPMPQIEWHDSKQRYFEIYDDKDLYEEGEYEASIVSKSVSREYSVLKEYLTKTNSKSRFES